MAIVVRYDRDNSEMVIESARGDARKSFDFMVTVYTDSGSFCFFGSEGMDLPVDQIRTTMRDQIASLRGGYNDLCESHGFDYRNENNETDHCLGCRSDWEREAERQIEVAISAWQQVKTLQPHMKLDITVKLD